MTSTPEPRPYAVRDGRCEFCRKKVTVWLNCGALGYLCNGCFESAYTFLTRRESQRRQAQASRRTA